MKVSKKPAVLGTLALIVVSLSLVMFANHILPKIRPEHTVEPSVGLQELDDRSPPESKAIVDQGIQLAAADDGMQKNTLYSSGKCRNRSI